MSKLRFAMIGSGRVAHHLAPALVRSGMECVVVYSPTLSHAEELAEQVQSMAVDNLSSITKADVDFVLLSIKDDALSDVIQAFPSDYSQPLFHTSGSTPIEVLDRVKHYGVLYPMQTFSKDRVIKIEEVPFFIETNDEVSEKLLLEITKQIGAADVHPLSSDNRGRLHLASVFACNFTNHLYAISDQVLREIGLDFGILQPLLEETLNKALSYPPKDVQTGPALRGDKKTMDRHISLLENHPDYQELYKILSESIYRQEHK